MECKLSHSSVSAVLLLQKLVKLAALVALPYREAEDSGIDSDEPTPLRAALTLQSSEESCSSSSDDDSPVSWGLPINKEGYPLKIMGEEQRERESLDFLQWREQNGDIRESSICESNADRSSSPLYEVELTASDEDDDASVLELVIPMQSRYQRVPTTSPTKTMPRRPRFLMALFCCVRHK